MYNQHFLNTASNSLAIKKNINSIHIYYHQGMGFSVFTIINEQFQKYESVLLNYRKKLSIKIEQKKQGFSDNMTI